jgi:hypothetical protein
MTHVTLSRVSTILFVVVIYAVSLHFQLACTSMNSAVVHLDPLQTQPTHEFVNHHPEELELDSFTL